MTYTPRFHLNQKVFAVSYDHGLIKASPCRACEGAGTVTINGEQFHCPKCRGGQRQSYHTRWFIVEKSEIGQVRIEATAEQYTDGYDKKLLVIQYMLRATGVGSGTIWDEEGLFATEEEAKAFCNEQNAEVEKRELIEK